jgi:protein phosphatase
VIFHWASATDTGRVRDHNEDAVWPLGDGRGEAPLVVAVADGMGGHIGGEVASRVALEAAVAAAGASAEERVRIANLAIIDEVLEQPRLAGMGTTLTLAVLDGDGAVDCAHVGDSRAYVLHEGRLDRLTRDHSLVAEMVESGELRPEEAAVHPFRSVVTRALGMERSVAVDRIAHTLHAGDRLLLCTDGLTAMADDEEIAAILAGAGTPRDAAEALVTTANQRGGTDNTTVVVVDVAPEDSPPVPNEA